MTNDQKITVLEAKLKLMQMLHERTSQAYHNAANIITNKFHTSSHWKDCDKATCVANRQVLQQVEDLDMESRPNVN